MTKAAHFRLSNITELNKVQKARVAGNRLFHSDSIATAAILYIFPSRITKKIHGGKSQLHNNPLNVE